MNKIILTGLLVLLTLQAKTQNAWDRHMELKSISIDVKINYFKAVSFIEMEFYNPAEKEIEGLYRFTLKPGQVITAFQLDLSGKYRDGSIEEKWKATNAYNTIVGKRIDPALLTMDTPGSYSLRIYPLPANGSRKVTLTIQEMLSCDSSSFLYQLPLLVLQKVSDVSITIQAPDAIETLTAGGLLQDTAFSRSAEGRSISYNGRDIALNKPIDFSFPFKEVSRVQTQAGKYQFALWTRPDVSVLPENTKKKLTVLWDASASAAQRDNAKEIGFLRQYLSYYNIHEMTLITFNHRELSRQHFSNPAAYKSWVSALEQTEYAGATQIGSVDLSFTDTDIVFIFSDGNNTWGKKTIPGLKGQVYAIHTAVNPDQKTLEKLTGTSGGRVINLHATKTSDAVIACNTEAAWLLDITSASGKTIIEQPLPILLDKPVFIHGIMPHKEDTLYLRYGSSRQTHVKVIIPDTEYAGVDDISRLHMLTKFEKTIHAYDWESILNFGIDEKVVTPNTAYLVLERVEDYARYNIAPPKELEEACRRINYVWRDIRVQRRQKRQADEYIMLHNVVNAYNKRIMQWDKNAPPIYLDRSAYENLKNPAPALPPAVNTNQANTLMGALPGIQVQPDNALEEVVVVGYSTHSRKQLTSAYTVIRSYEIPPFQTIEQALQGRVAGVQVVSTGQPGAMPFINIRGAASVNPNNQPLWVLDGIPVSGNINDLIAANNIESITVLKDASATALYGSRAAFGAILITSKKGTYHHYNRYNPRPYRLKDMEDPDYIKVFRELPGTEKRSYYMAGKKQYAGQTGFFFDMADLFFRSGMTYDAREALMEAIETGQGREPVLSAAAYLLEKWENYEDAITIYRELREAFPDNLQHSRNQAWAHYKNKQYQEATDILYAALKQNVEDEGLKAMLLAEMNAIIGAHSDAVDISGIPPGIIFNMPVDYRVVLDCNTGNLVNAYVKEPRKERAGHLRPLTKNGGQFILHYPNHWYQPYAEYQQKIVVPGKYRLGLNYYNYYAKSVIPVYVRIMTFTNFGKPGQSLKVENIVMDNQNGDVEIADWKW